MRQKKNLTGPKAFSLKISSLLFVFTPLLRYKWYTKIAYLMHTTWWVWNYANTSNVITTNRTVDMGNISQCFLLLVFLLLFKNKTMLLMLLLTYIPCCQDMTVSTYHKDQELLHYTELFIWLIILLKFFNNRNSSLLELFDYSIEILNRI